MLSRTSDSRRRSSLMTAKRVSESAVKSTVKPPSAASAATSTAVGSTMKSRLPRASVAAVGSTTKSRLARASVTTGASAQRAGSVSTGQYSAKSLGGAAGGPRASQRLGSMTPQPVRQLSMARAGPATASKFAAGRTSMELGRRMSRGSGIGTARNRCPDPRPINDKQFIQATTQRVVAFLNEKQRGGRGFDGAPVANKDLAKFTGRDFDAVFTFVYGFFNPAFTLQNKKRELEVPQAMKGLGYPGQLSKSHLVTIGCAHSWPPIIAALGWLVELVEIVFGADPIQTLMPTVEVNGFAEPDGEYRTLFDHWLDSYDMWLLGQDVPAEERERELRGALDMQSDFAVHPSDLSRLEAEKKHLQEKLKEMESGNEKLAERLKETSERRDTMETDVRRLTEYIDTMQHKNDEHNKDKERLALQVVGRNRDIQRMEERQAALRREVESQEFSAEDVARIVQQTAALMKQVEERRSEIQQVEGQNGELEMELQRRESQLEADVRQLNAQLQQLPAAAEAAALELRLRGPVADQIQQLQTLEKSWDRAERLARRDLDRNNTALLHQEAALREMRGSLETARQEQFHLETRLRRLEEEEAAGRAQVQLQHAELSSQMDEVESQIGRVTSDINQLNLPAKRAKVETKTKLYYELKEKMDKQYADRVCEVQGMAALALDFKQRVEGEKDRLHQGIAQIQSDTSAEIQRRLSRHRSNMDKENQDPPAKDT